MSAACFECGGLGRTSRVECGVDLVNGPDDGSLMEPCSGCRGSGIAPTWDEDANDWIFAAGGGTPAPSERET